MIKNVHLDKQGIELFVGPLEAQVLRTLWAVSDVVTVTRLHNIMINDGSNAAFSTIHTTVIRMTAKGLIIPTTKKYHKLKYWRAVTKDEAEFIMYCVDATLTHIKAEYPDDFFDWIRDE